MTASGETLTVRRSTILGGLSELGQL